MSQFVVGVSGGIGSGKTTVTDLFHKKGIEVIDADIIARQVVQPGMPALVSIVEKFGEALLDEHGQLKRAALRRLIFTDNKAKDWVNSLLHPAIREQMLIQTQNAKSDYCLLSVPLLVENQLQKTVNRVLIVDVTEQNQLDRTLLRDQSQAQQIRAIMGSQASREQRLAVADDVIDNNGAPESLLVQVDHLHRSYQEWAK
jgi:dephospho-CoA kinase